MKTLLASLFLLCCLLPSSRVAGQQISFKQLSTLNGLANDEVQQVLQDSDGFIWIATRYGLCKYDGYQVSLYKSNLYTPELFTNNNILCLAEDTCRNIWIGTLEGINILNKETGRIRKGTYPQIGTNTISCLLATTDGSVWIGNDGGLLKYIPETDTMELYDQAKTNNVMGSVSIKALYQDSDGDIWIGTWNDGLYRYDPKAGVFHAYPQMNSRNSAHVIYQDSKDDMWVVGWSEGLYKLANPKDMDNVSWTAYRHDPKDANSLSDDFVYDICEDTHTGNLWVGTRSGLSILTPGNDRTFINYKPGNDKRYIPCNEINSIIRDQAGNMWIGAVGGGVLMTDTRKSKFNMYRFDADGGNIPTSSVRAIFVDDDQSILLGVGTYGLARHDRVSNELTFYPQMPEFAGVAFMPTVYSIVKRKHTGEIWLGTYDGGLYVFKKGEKARHYDQRNSDFVKHPNITAIFEDSKGNCWVGTRNGVGVLGTDGKGYLFDEMMVDNTNAGVAYVRDIEEDEAGNIWLATTNYGLIRISGDYHRPSSLKYSGYNTENRKITTKSILCLRRDSKNRLWVGSEGHGLFLYNPDTDSFADKSLRYNIPGDMVGSIEEDRDGHLWLGTNNGLVRLTLADDLEGATLRVYTSIDGLQDNFFIPRASFNKDGELFFGGYKGYNSFRSEELRESQMEAPFAVTDIQIFNRSFSLLDEKLQARISQRTPAYTDRIEIPYKYNNFSFEFASLTYKNPEQNKYAYKLEGFDREWRYTDASRRFAYYNNLRSGAYTFLLKATDENGIWSDDVKEVAVIVHPPVWATWWAYLLYFVVIAVIVLAIYRTARNRMALKNSLQLQKMAQAKSEELNHAKLQFFTNITHELLTPLTIISATVDELKAQAPQYSHLYPTVSTNIQRLIRLLQQILEFRKAETGNLRLRVSPGEIAQFVRNEAEAFLPLIKRRKLHFSIVCDPESITGYFDTDKLDKILYNLLSNAAKYNRDGGFIQLDLSYAEDKDFILLKVKDSGKGLSAETRKTLFKRFYEGDYRRSNTIGTGIGLSLVKDLVDLHGGSISVESEVDVGTTFIVKLPIDKSYFKEDEIDEEVIPVISNVSDIVDGSTEVRSANESKPNSVLVLEDNEDLLQLMVTLLNREYNVFTAENGKEGLVVMDNEDIDLIVSDIMMPEMDGIEFTREVKNRLEFSHIPVILLTAKNKEEDRAEAYESGADGFISKPFNLTVLHARIKNLLKAKERMARDFKNQLVFELKDLNYTSLDEEFMQKAIECVNRHLDDPDFDQPQFIDEMGTSKSTLYKKLKSLTGLNTSAFIRNIRLKAAVKIMEEKRNIRVSELAYAVGFNDPKYFSSCFKKEFGMLPSEYIERFLPMMRE